MLLATKLFVPRPRSSAVRRDRLYDRLDEGEASDLMLVAAPAGFGKTALLSGWVHERGQAVAWLSLSEDDDDPPRFWSYLIEALRTVDDSIGNSALQLLQSPQLPSSETIATIVVNDLAASSQDIVCVLDDYHLIVAEPTHDSLIFLVEHMPPNARLILSTRADPPWPLARLRASDRMVELREADLRFTEDEATLFLEAAGLSLSGDEIEMLESRTEGWVAGLQMAALSMQDRDAASFIRHFAGDHRFVLDYLAEEVLGQLPAQKRSFLLQTSILVRLHGGLCDAVTERDGSQQILEELVQEHVFTESLDDERRWYRYHQLFADVLRSQLAEEQPDRLPELHRRASAWFEANGLDEEAIHHALEADEVDRAARLIARAASTTFMVANQLLVLEWLRRLPQEAIAATPVLALAGVWARFVIGDLEGVEPALEVATKAIEFAAASPDREALQSQLDGILSWVAYQRGDLEGCVELAREALPRMPEDGLVPSQIVAAAQGYGMLLMGETESARALAGETIAQSRRAGDALTECLAIGLEAQALLLEGQLERAARAYERAVATGTVGGEALPSVAIAQVQLAEVLRERNDLGEAERTLRTSIAACERAMGLPEWVFEGNVTLARVLAAQGDAAGADQAAEDAERVLEREIVPGGMEPIVGRALGYRVRHWLATGEVERAVAWLRQHGISGEGALDGPDQTLQVLFAKALLTQGEHEEAHCLADRLLDAAGDTPHVGPAVELALVKAIALRAMEREAEAAEMAADALRAAEPEGYVRLFVDEGAPMVELLERATPEVPAHAGYVERLMTALGAGGDRADGTSVSPLGVPLEPLNERELALLRMFAVGRSNREIAEELYLSVNTVKWHARNLYAKLGVHRRSVAVARAKELGIL